MKKSDRSDRYNLNFEKDESYIKEFCKAQNNFTDTIRYLIEEDIRVNGIRNLQEHIPSKRPAPISPAPISLEPISSEPINQSNNDYQEKKEEKPTFNHEEKINQEQTAKDVEYNCYSDGD